MTLRVERFSRRNPTRASNPFMAWLSADCVTPRRLAARVKLPSFATVAKESRSVMSCLAIAHPRPSPSSLVPYHEGARIHKPGS